MLPKVANMKQCRKQKKPDTQLASYKSCVRTTYITYTSKELKQIKWAFCEPHVNESGFDHVLVDVCMYACGLCICMQKCEFVAMQEELETVQLGDVSGASSGATEEYPGSSSRETHHPNRVKRICYRTQKGRPAKTWSHSARRTGLVTIQQRKEINDGDQEVLPLKQRRR